MIFINFIVFKPPTPLSMPYWAVPDMRQQRERSSSPALGGAVIEGELKLITGHLGRRERKERAHHRPNCRRWRGFIWQVAPYDTSACSKNTVKQLEGIKCPVLIVRRCNIPSFIVRGYILDKHKNSECKMDLSQENNRSRAGLFMGFIGLVWLCRPSLHRCKIESFFNFFIY